MANSAYKAFIPFAASAFDEDDPVGVDIGHVLANNALYFADSNGQVRIKWIAPSASEELTYALGSDYRANDQLDRIWGTQIDVHLHPNDGAFRFRVRFAGRSTGGDSTEFRVYIGQPSQAHILEAMAASATLDWTANYTTTATTSAWLAEDGAKSLLECDPDHVMRSVIAQRTITAVSGGRDSSVLVCRLAVEVWGKSAAVSTSDPNFAGLEVTEYIGT